MMTNDESDECIHGIFPATSCTICKPKPKPTVEDYHEGWTMTAKYDGQCPECNLPIVADTHTIRFREGKWMHKRCADRLVQNG